MRIWWILARPGSGLAVHDVGTQDSGRQYCVGIRIPALTGSADGHATTTG